MVSMRQFAYYPGCIGFGMCTQTRIVEIRMSGGLGTFKYSHIILSCYNDFFADNTVRM